MSIIQKLASSLGRRDEIPNQQLAQAIASTNDAAAVNELADLLRHKDKNIQSDAIKVLYEIAEHKPELVAAHFQLFLELLKGKNNRLAWGAMTALDAISSVNPEGIFECLPDILDAADSGSVITRDHAVSILTKLAGNEKYAAFAFPLLLEQMANCPPNQMPMYAENALPVVKKENAADFQKTAAARMDDLPKESQKKRLEKVLKRAEKI